MAHSFSADAFLNAKPVQNNPLNKTYVPALEMELVNASLDQAADGLLAPGRRRAFFMNAHCCNIRRHDPLYARAVAEADMLLPDGIGIELAAGMTGASLGDNLNGTDLLPLLLAKAAQRGESVFLFGGRPGTADVAANTLVHQLPHLRIAGTCDGYAGAAHTQTVIDQINDSGADIVLVALGVPAQEIWLHKNARHLNARLTLGVGALFDFLAGNVVRAPKLVRNLRAEWIWRLAQEPRRLAKRYLLGNLTFLAHAGKTAAHQVPSGNILRRGLDVAISISALFLLSPLLLLTALAIRTESRGPVLFKQTRVGLNGAEFTIFKFRSMSTDAEARRASLLDQSDREGVCFKARNDPRVTRVGKFIRRFSIDELPQVLNVLRGEMSIVGPRPALPSEVAQYPERAMGRLAVKPGITGVWQVSGRAKIGFDHMVEMDLAYAAGRTVLFDLYIILRTFRAVTSGNGAY